jgi:hypothetical protein
MNKLDQAYEIAQKADVSSALNGAVLYSVSYLPTKENKLKAAEYVKNHQNCTTLDETECGRGLIALGLETDFKAPQDELMKVWAIASERFITAASGNVTAFVENADSRSTFVRTELPNLLKNDKISTINGEDKFIFAEKFKK